MEARIDAVLTWALLVVTFLMYGIVIAWIRIWIDEERGVWYRKFELNPIRRVR